MKCTNCGKEIANDSVFCEYCGTAIQVSSGGIAYIADPIEKVRAKAEEDIRLKTGGVTDDQN